LLARGEALGRDGRIDPKFLTCSSWAAAVHKPQSVLSDPDLVERVNVVAAPA
jgi:hypothetical protein